MKKIVLFTICYLGLFTIFVGCSSQYVKAPDEYAGQKEVKPEKIEKEEVTEKILAQSPEISQKNTDENIITKESTVENVTNIKIKDFKLTDIYFDFDKYNISQDATPILDSTSLWLKENRQIKIMIEGHCDERGTYEYNFALGEKRAKSTKDYFLTLGINLDRINTISYGEEKPICTEQNEECWQKNRRAHFVISD